MEGKSVRGEKVEGGELMGECGKVCDVEVLCYGCKFGCLENDKLRCLCGWRKNLPGKTGYCQFYEKI